MLFELYTAAGFHFHKANEAVVRVYAKSKGLILKKEYRTLGNYANALEKKDTPAQITKELKRIVNEVRNPLVLFQFNSDRLTGGHQSRAGS